MKKTLKKEIGIPEGITVKIELQKVVVTGPLGSIEKIFKFQSKIKLRQESKKIILECLAATKKEKKILNTLTAHLKNMVKGVVNDFEYTLQICSIHFPITTSINKDENLFLIKNFLGETQERTAKIPQGVDVSIKGDIVTLKGIEIEKVSQGAANIEKATWIKGKDRRVYQDGIWITKKAGKEV